MLDLLYIEDNKILQTDIKYIIAYIRKNHNIYHLYKHLENEAQIASNKLKSKEWALTK